MENFLRIFSRKFSFDDLSDIPQLSNSPKTDMEWRRRME